MVLMLAMMVPHVPGQGHVMLNRPKEDKYKTANHQTLQPSTVERVRAMTTQYVVHIHQP
jgi:hypothetical protein